MQIGKTASVAITVLLISAAIFTVFTYTQVAQAYDPVLYVAPTPTGTEETGGSCSAPGFNTIQAAINVASPGERIFICPGTYTEQDTITKSLTITAANPSSPPTILAPPALSLVPDGVVCTGSPPMTGYCITDIVDISGTSVTVAMSDLTISGPNTGPIAGVQFGIFVYGGANLILSDSVITEVGYPSDGNDMGIALQVGSSPGIYPPTALTVGHATVTNVNINQYHKNGITVDGVGSMLTVSHSVVTGLGPTQTQEQNAIQVSDSANANIQTTTISDSEWGVNGVGTPGWPPGPDIETQQQATGILLYGPVGTSTVIEGNTITDCDVAIYAYETNGLTDPNQIASNTIVNPTYYGVVLQDSSLTLSNNRFTGGFYGVAVVADTQDVTATLHGNTFSGQTEGSVFTYWSSTSPSAWEGTPYYASVVLGGPYQ